MAPHSDTSKLNWDLFNKASKDIFKLIPHGWQSAVGTVILDAVSSETSIKHLCVWPIGGGKSLESSLQLTC